MILIPPQPHSIAHATADALSKLSALSENSQSHTDSGHCESNHYSDEIDRLEIWAHEHDVGYGGLDYKLRENTRLRKRVLSLLAQLSGTTDQSSNDDEESERTAVLETLRTGTPMHLILDKEDDDATSLSLGTDCTLPDPLPDSPLTHIHDVVNLLFGLGPTLLNPVPRDRFEFSAHEEAVHYDVGHVQAKFPQANDSLIERLGRASWECRRYLTRLRSKLIENDHYALEQAALNNFSLVDTPLKKLTLGSLSSDSGADLSDGDVSDVGEALTAVSQAHGYGPEKDEPSPEFLSITTASSLSNVGFSANDAHSTALEAPPQVVSHTEPNVSRYEIRAPPHPNEHLSGDDFLCPFCAHRVSDMKSAANWKSVILPGAELWLVPDIVLRIDSCAENTCLKTCNHICAPTEIVCFRPKATGVGRLGGSMRRSVTGHNAPGYAHHVREETSNLSSILRPRSRSISATTTLLDLRRCRCST